MSTLGLAENEQALIQTAQRGDLDAFNALILAYQDSVYTAAYRIMGEAQAASDVVQEAFILAFRRLNTYRGGSFRAWLLRITTNQCYDELRRQRRKPSISVEELPDADSDDGPALSADTDTPEQAMQQRELQGAIQQCINSLAPDQRVVLVMSDIEEFSYQEIADHLGANLGTVKSRLSRARAGVRDCLQAVRELLPAVFRLNNEE